VFWRRRERGGGEARGQETPERGTPEGETDAVEAAGPTDPAATPDGPAEEPIGTEPRTGPIEVERDAPRVAAISRVAEELNARGERVVELFEEVDSPRGRAILPIHTRRRDGSDAFVEVETGPWDEDTVGGVIGTAAVLRASRYGDAPFDVLGAYPVPPEVRFFSGTSPAALFQLDLVLGATDDPEGSAAAFADTASRRWDIILDYTPEGLPLVEDLLLAALSDGNTPNPERPEGAGAEGGPFVLDVLAYALGCYVGETLRRAARPLESAWTEPDGTEDPTVEFEEVVADPIGKARAFLENGAEDSIAFYVSYALEELGRSETPAGTDATDETSGPRPPAAGNSGTSR